ncbi:MAG TPA: HYR domain-containing protein, partial [Saprospiraceae bacterium]|nr:HYR domain-containing protein [Saprospiraceae bacterium]
TYAVVATDANGCSQTASISITSNDTEAPALDLQHVTLPLASDGTVEVSLQNLGATLTDNCAVANVVINPAVFDCDQLGEHEVTVTATDESGNSTTATTTVDIVDNLAPVLTCPASITECEENNIVAYDLPVAVDNCIAEGGGNWQLLNGLPSGSEFPVGVTTQTYAYTDPSGNTGSCAFDVIILAPASVVASLVVNDLNNQGVGSIDIVVSGGTSPYSFQWYKDGAPFASTEDIANLGAGTYSVEITDANGCSFKSAEYVVSNTSATTEPEWLRGVQLRPNPTSGITRVVFNITPDNSLDIQLSDATGRVVMTQTTDHQNMVELDCGALPEGVYFVQFRTGQDFGVRRLVVSH